MCGKARKPLRPRCSFFRLPRCIYPMLGFPLPLYRGHIDSVADGRVCGWVRDDRSPNKRLTVEIYAARTLLGTTCADVFRQDLAEAGNSDGKHAFVFDLPSDDFAPDSFSARVARTHYWLLDTRDDPVPSGAASSLHGAKLSADWARTMVDPESFALEQQSLAHSWTFLGLTRDVENDGDWFRASLATREVFVQRFGTELRGFENICRHRFYPLRLEDRGNGPMICGFHNWQYNRDGLAIGIPQCREVYGALPHELNARLTPIEIATCGSLIFGRFSSEDTQSLRGFLADSFPILEAVSRMPAPPQLLTDAIAANWRLCLHITLDDYHGPTIHSKTLARTLGKSDRSANPRDIVYRRFGDHSAFLATPDHRAFDRMVTGCRDGTFYPSHYMIFQILPNLVVSLSPLSEFHWYCYIQQFVPIAPDRTLYRSYVYRSPFDAPSRWPASLVRRLVDLFILRLTARYHQRVANEDRDACEHMQKRAHQFGSNPLLGRLETRIGWFEDSYRQLLKKTWRGGQNGPHQ
jgi:phenylpropionate dioxygenase-like ring-hydroxylating dioxygenase large terminal subunit